MDKHKRTSISLADKLKVIATIESGIYQAVTGRQLGINKSTVTAIWKDRDRIKENGRQYNLKFKKVRKCGFETVDERLLEWFRLRRSRNIAINGPILKQTAKDIATEENVENFEASEGWLDNWKKRHGIVFKIAAGESAAVDLAGIETWVKDVWPSLCLGYEPKDIFNADETGLFYRLLPQKTYDFKGQECHGGKHSKERLTVLLCANGDGSEKMKPLVIGKSTRPRCFKGIRGLTKLPVQYKSNQKAWMTSKIFQSWLNELNQRMKRSKRKILLVMDNCAPHVASDTRLDHVRCVFLPPNTTSIVQPLDKGIINSMKTKYRCNLTKKVIAKLDNKEPPKIDVLEAIYGIVSSWNEVSQTVIRNCFLNSGLISKPNDQLEPEENIENVTEESLNIENVLFEDYVSVDNNVITAEDSCLAENAVTTEASENDNINISHDSDDDSSEIHRISSEEAFVCIEKLKIYAKNKGNWDVYSEIQKLEKLVINDSYDKPKQSKITEFFSQ